MRFALTLPVALLLALSVCAQDATSSAPAAASSAPAIPDTAADTGADDGFTAPPEQDSTLPWNITYFVVPTRNNYWVNDAINSAKWTPVNVATNLMLSNSNSSISGQRVVLAQNIPGGTSTWTGRIEGYPPGNNYMLQLTAAGNPDHKFAQSQGFWIKPNGTAMPQQVAGVPPSTPIGPGGASPNAAAVSGSSPGGDGVAGANAGGGAAPAGNNNIPGLASGASTASVASAAGVLVLAAVGLNVWL